VSEDEWRGSKSEESKDGGRKRRGSEKENRKVREG
jgi:hypothetical protein